MKFGALLPAAAGIPPAVWNRDLRKSGSTEARRSGAHIDDLKKLMGHAAETPVTADVYNIWPTSKLIAELPRRAKLSQQKMSVRPALRTKAHTVYDIIRLSGRAH